MKPKRLMILAALTVCLLTISACVVNRFRVGSLVTDTESIELGDAETVRAEIRMGAGEIDVSGGASALMDAEFRYNVDELDPVVSYDVAGATGRLTVEHRDTEGFPWGDYEDARSEWDLRFNDEVPMDLTIFLGAAKGDIDLRGLALTSLNVQVGAGEADLWLGNNPLRNMDLEIGAGEFTLDMTGAWAEDLDAEVSGGVGQLTIYLPSDVGVRVNVQMGIAVVDTKGLQKDGATYTNDAYGSSDVTLRLDVQGGIGNIQLIVRE